MCIERICRKEKCVFGHKATQLPAPPAEPCGKPGCSKLKGCPKAHGFSMHPSECKYGSRCSKLGCGYGHAHLKTEKLPSNNVVGGAGGPTHGEDMTNLRFLEEKERELEEELRKLREEIQEIHKREQGRMRVVGGTGPRLVKRTIYSLTSTCDCCGKKCKTLPPHDFPIELKLLKSKPLGEGFELHYALCEECLEPGTVIFEKRVREFKW